MAYSYKRSETVQAAQVTGTLTNYPAFFSRTHNDFRTVGNGGHVQNASGYDLNLFADAAGAPGAVLDIETESYNAATGAVLKWARVPSIATSTVVWWQYGDSGISTSQDSVSAVWDANYTFVSHNGGLTDVIGTPFTVTNNGTVSISGFPGGSGREFYSPESRYLALAATGTHYSVVTVEAWVLPTTFVTYPAIASKGYDGTNTEWQFYIDTTGHLVAGSYNGSSHSDTSTDTLSTAVWAWVAMRYTGSAWQTRKNGGTTHNTTDATGPVSTARAHQIGSIDAIGSPSQFFNGSIGEIRISNSARSDGWWEANYKNQFAPTAFWGLGTEQSVGAFRLVPPRIVRQAVNRSATY